MVVDFPRSLMSCGQCINPQSVGNPVIHPQSRRSHARSLLGHVSSVCGFCGCIHPSVYLKSHGRTLVAIVLNACCCTSISLLRSRCIHSTQKPIYRRLGFYMEEYKVLCAYENFMRSVESVQYILHPNVSWRGYMGRVGVTFRGCRPPQN